MSSNKGRFKVDTIEDVFTRSNLCGGGYLKHWFSEGRSFSAYGYGMYHAQPPPYFFPKGNYHAVVFPQIRSHPRLLAIAPLVSPSRSTPYPSTAKVS